MKPQLTIAQKAQSTEKEIELLKNSIESCRNTIKYLTADMFASFESIENSVAHLKWHENYLRETQNKLNLLNWILED